MKNIHVIIYLFLLVNLSLSIMGCGEKMVNNENNINILSDEDVKNLLNMKIIFGHASVGNNILEGIRNICQKDKRLKSLNIYDLNANKVINGPGIYHFGIKKNGYPLKKNEHFLKMLNENGNGDKCNIAFFKYCYVDIEKDANIQELISEYNKTINTIKKRFPKLYILHVTSPLYSHGRGMKGLIKKIIKTDYNNIVRNEYNYMVKKIYSEDDTIYDLAKIESTNPDGTRSSFKYKGKTYYSLSNNYTDDGGHLNNDGQYIAAVNLLKVLSNISKIK